MHRDPSTPRPLAQVPVAAHGHQIQDRHQTVLPDEPAEATEALALLLSNDAFAALRSGVSELRKICAAHPQFLDGWARLGQAVYLEGDHLSAYAFARVGYHRGLDRLRRNGWGGTGQVRWSEDGNKGFLRALHLLMVASAAIGDGEENLRCRQFLIDLDPTDELAIAQRPPLVDGELVGAADLP